MTRDHRGIAYHQGYRRGPVGHAPQPDQPDPRRARCRECGRRVMWVRKTYGPHARAGHWQHVGDGLAQYRSW